MSERDKMEGDLFAQPNTERELWTVNNIRPLQKQSFNNKHAHMTKREL